jgi:hypothetical protein
MRPVGPSRRSPILERRPERQLLSAELQRHHAGADFAQFSDAVNAAPPTVASTYSVPSIE